MAENLGASFTIDITQLKAGLAQANRLIRESESEFRAAAAGMDDWTKSQEGLEKKIKSLTDIAGVQEKKVEALKAEYNRLISEGLDPTSAKATDLRTQINKETEALNKSKAEIEKQTAALGKLQSESSDAGNKTETLTQKVERQESELKTLKDRYIDVASEQGKTSDEAKELAGKIESLSGELKENKTKLKETSDAADDLDQSFEETSSGGISTFSVALGNVIADVVMDAITKLKDLALEALNVGKQFDSSMSQVGAVSGASADEMELLEAKAKEMGSTTKFTASEAADAFNYMAMAGWKTEDMINGIDGVLNLAAASGSDLATTSDIVTDALTAMGYSAGDAGRLADVMAAASSNANTNVEMMGQTFKYAAPVAGALGYSMEDTAVAIGLMANAGIKADQAGTSLRSIMTRLSAPPKECATAMEELGISLTDGEGNMKTLEEVMQDLRGAFSGLSETEQTAAAKHIAGQEAMSGLLAIVNAAPEDFDKLTDAVADSEGAAQEMADTMLNNLGGDMTLLKSKVEGVQLALYKKFEPALRAVVKAADKLIDGITWLSKKLEPFTPLITAVATAFGLLAGKLAIVWLINKLKAAFTLLWGVMAANPVTLIIGAIAGLVAGFKYLWDNCESFREFWTNAWENIKEVASMVWEAITGFFSAAWDKIKAVWATVGDFFAEVWEKIKAVFAPVGEFFTAIWEGIKAVLKPFIDWFVAIFKWAWDTIKAVWNAVVYYFTGIWDGIKAVFSPIISWFSEKFTAAWNGIKGVFSAVGEFFKGVWTSIATPFLVVSDFFKGVFKRAWEGIKSVFSKVGDFFGGIWDTIKEKFSEVGTKVADAIGGAFKTAINAVIATVEGAINLIPNAINKALDLINELPGVDIPKMPTISLPRLAKGGVVRQATNAIIGEDGAEAVMPLEKNTGWMDVLAEKIAAKGGGGVVVNQTNNYSQQHSRYEIYKSQQATARAVKLAMAR